MVHGSVLGLGLASHTELLGLRVKQQGGELWLLLKLPGTSCHQVPGAFQYVYSRWVNTHRRRHPDFWSNSSRPGQAPASVHLIMALSVREDCWKIPGCLGSVWDGRVQAKMGPDSSRPLLTCTSILSSASPSCHHCLKWYASKISAVSLLPLCFS